MSKMDEAENGQVVQFFWAGPFSKMDNCPNKWANNNVSPQTIAMRYFKIALDFKNGKCPS